MTTPARPAVWACACTPGNARKLVRCLRCGAWRPHDPVDPRLPPHVVEMCERGMRRVDACRVQIGADGVCPVPFVCFICDQRRHDFALLTGDGVPVCWACFDRQAAALGGG